MFGAARTGLRLAVIGAAAAALAACDSKGGGASASAQRSPAQACLQSTDPAAVDTCRAALQASPDDLALRKRIALLRLKAGSLAAARQAYQIVLATAPGDTEALFGLALTLEAVGEPDANKKKLEAATRDPSVIGTFRKYGFSDLDLMLFDTAPLVFDGQSPEKDKAMEPKQPHANAVTVSVKCQVALTRTLHGCVVTSPLTPDQAVFGEAAKTILAPTKAEPAKNKGKPVADAPIVLTYVFWPNA